MREEPDPFWKESVRQWAEYLGLPVPEERLTLLAERVRRMLESLSRLDELDLEDSPPPTAFRPPGPTETSS
jgi:hypothetical protein